jgi:hypothetical protein
MLEYFVVFGSFSVEVSVFTFFLFDGRNHPAAAVFDLLRYFQLIILRTNFLKWNAFFSSQNIKGFAREDQIVIKGVFSCDAICVILSLWFLGGKQFH